MGHKSDIGRNEWMLKYGNLGRQGYDWWWHSFTAENEKTGERKPFFIEFFVCNEDLAEPDPVIVWNDEGKRSKGIRPSYLMVKAGFWGKEKGQLHRFFSLMDTTFSKKVPFEICAHDCRLNETHTEGSISVSEADKMKHPEWMSDAGSISWKLDIDKKIAFNVGYGASKFFRKINAFEMFWHAEGMKTAFTGEITLNGVKYRVFPESCNGYSDKNWGKNFTSPWVWLSSNNLYSRKYSKKLENSVFDIGGGKPKIYCIPLNRKLLGTIYYEGKEYEFNFSKFWTFSRTAFNCYETDDKIVWKVKQKTFSSILETEVTCDKRYMLNINYEAPDGTKKYSKLWNGGTGEGTLKLYSRRLFGKPVLIDEIEAREIGCEYGEFDQ